ncbi:hypothetical protein S83_055922, partial [Arachis hypogaea]
REKESECKRERKCGGTPLFPSHSPLIFPSPSLHNLTHLSQSRHRTLTTHLFSSLFSGPPTKRQCFKTLTSHLFSNTLQQLHSHPLNKAPSYK